MSKELAVNPDQAKECLSAMSAETSDRVAWAIEQIADAGFSVAAPEQMWAGKNEIISRVTEKFGMDPLDAARLVDLAVLDLWHGGTSAPHAERRLLVARLNIVRRIILEGLREPKKTTTYAFKVTRNKETGEQDILRIPKRQQVKEGIDPNMVRLLIDIEGMIVKLNNFGEGENTELVAEIFKQLERDSDGQTKEKVVTSISQRVKSMDLSKMTASGRKAVEDAMAQERSRKRVKSAPVGKGTNHGEPQEDPEGSGEAPGGQGPDGGAGSLRPGAGQPDEAE